MKFLRLIAPALSLCLADAYLVAPPGTPAPGAHDACSAWIQSSYGLTCEIIRRFWGMSQEELEEWNPSIGRLGNDCTLITGLYYCVQINYVTQTPTWTPPPTSTTSTTTATSTGGGDPNPTPTPTQPGMVDNCDEFYLVVGGDSCFDIAAAHDVALADFYDWNPAIGTSCGGLWPDYYVCVGVAGGSTTTTRSTTTTTTTTTTTSPPGNGIATPTPIQSGMVTNCDDFYLVVPNDSCFDIAAEAGIPLQTFYDWNPALGTSCGGLWPDYYVCVGIIGQSPTITTTTTSRTTTTTGNGIATPTPTQPSMVGNCDRFYLVVSNDSCFDIAAEAGIALADFYRWNPAVGNNCGGLWPDYYVCIGILAKEVFTADKHSRTHASDLDYVPSTELVLVQEAEDGSEPAHDHHRAPATLELRSSADFFTSEASCEPTTASHASRTTREYSPAQSGLEEYWTGRIKWDEDDVEDEGAKKMPLKAFRLMILKHLRTARHADIRAFHGRYLKDKLLDQLDHLKGVHFDLLSLTRHGMETSGVRTFMTNSPICTHKRM
ncbi:hypothetical protein BDV12DRAFT_203586 [Aspergillus spectabilis]